MTQTSLIFDGTHDAALLWLILLATSLALLGWGVAQLFAKRWRYAAVCLGASFGPAFGLPAAVAGLFIRFAKPSPRREFAVWSLAAIIAGSLTLLAIRAVGAEISSGAWVVLLGVHLGIAVGVFYAAVYAHLGTGRLVALMALRSAAILALLLILFKPAVSRTFVPARPAGATAPLLPILVDCSGSMGTADLDDPARLGGPRPGVSRYNESLRLLRAAAPDMQADFQLAWYSFASQARKANSLEALEKLSPADTVAQQTELVDAIQAIRRDCSPTDAPAVLLISDGINNPQIADKNNARVLAAVESSGLRVFTASVGSKDGPSAPVGKNVSVESVTVLPAAVARNNVAEVKVRVRIEGFPRVPVKLRLMEKRPNSDEYEELDSADIWTHADRDDREETLKWTARSGAENPAADARPDIRRLRVTCQPQAGETQADDNQADVNVLVTSPRVRLFWVEGSMRPEYKYLKRLLDADPNVQLQTLVRVSGNKFWAQGSLDGRQLTGLPVGDDEFKLFDVLILGDVDRTYLTAEQMTSVRGFVNNGGGLLMIGGQNSFGPGGYEGTDIEQALPVQVGPRSQAQEATTFIPQLTAEGVKHPILEGVREFWLAPGAAALKPDAPAAMLKMPELRGCVAVASAKPLAEVLAVHPTRRNAAGPLVVLAVQQFGRGRSAALTADTTWLWYAWEQSQGVAGAYGRLWGQLVRWLASAESKSRGAAASVLAQLDPSRTVFRQRERVTVRAVVQSGEPTAISPSRIRGRVISASGGEPQTLTMAADADATKNVFTASFTPDSPGKYTVELSLTDPAGAVKASDSLPLVVLKGSDQAGQTETDPANLRPDRELLERIARTSGGEHRPVEELDRLVAAIRELTPSSQVETAPPPRPRIYPLYDFTLLFVVFVVLLTGEWLLRRAWQLH